MQASDVGVGEFGRDITSDIRALRKLWPLASEVRESERKAREKGGW